MSDYNARSIPAGRADMAVDAGLRSFMLGVFNKMALGLALSATLAYIAASVPPITQIVFNTPLYFVFAFGPIVILMISAFAMRKTDWLFPCYREFGAAAKVDGLYQLKAFGIDDAGAFAIAVEDEDLFGKRVVDDPIFICGSEGNGL